VERLTLGHLVPSSESASNTQAAPESAVLAGTAPGSAGLLPPSPTSDVVIDTAGGAVRDHAHFVTSGGESGARPPESGPWTRAGRDEGGWTQT